MCTLRPYLIPILTILVLQVYVAFGQSVTEIQGVILRKDSLAPIAGAVIVNKNKLLGTMTNAKGEFKMKISLGDTLKVSHIGFNEQLVYFSSMEYKEEDKIRIVLSLRTYELQGVEVRPYRIRRPKEKPPTMERTDNITYDLGPFRLGAGSGQFYNPHYAGYGMIMPVFGAPIPDFKELNRLRQFEKIDQIEAKNTKKRYVSLRYNKNYVHKITGLKGNELENFMNYCRISDKEILEASEYDLTYKILDCYKNFRLDQE